MSGITSGPSQIIVGRKAPRQNVRMNAQREATIRGAADRHPVNAFRLHHFAGLGC